ncbi:MAG: CapA family protein, partial [Gemmiger sp.]|nr:CapA family protein [Gemmiger sp.]
LDITFQKTTQPDGRATLALQEPKLHPVITQYENGYKDIRAYLYPDYTDALGAQHGNFTLSRAYIEDVFKNSVDAQFISWE